MRGEEEHREPGTHTGEPGEDGEGQGEHQRRWGGGLPRGRAVKGGGEKEEGGEGGECERRGGAPHGAGIAHERAWGGWGRSRRAPEKVEWRAAEGKSGEGRRGGRGGRRREGM